MKRNTVIVIIAIAIIAILGGILLARPENPRPVENQTKTSPESSSETFTHAEVAMHNNAGDCYTIVGKNVYNVTSWINMHPGGKEAIIELCGIDATAQFSQQHGSDKQAQSVLASFLIGTLID